MKDEALKLAQEALGEIALAGMSGSGQESEEAMTEWHARQAWKFVGIAARALDSIKQATAQPAPVQDEPIKLDHIACIDSGVLRYMTGRKAPNYDCELYAMPDGKDAPRLYTTPPAQPPVPLTDEDELSNGLAMALHDAVLIRIGKDDEATRQAIARIDKLVAKYKNEAAHGITAEPEKGKP